MIRCAWCHEERGGGVSCARCAARVHAACGLEHAACPTCAAPLDGAALAAALKATEGLVRGTTRAEVELPGRATPRTGPAVAAAVEAHDDWRSLGPAWEPRAFLRSTPAPPGEPGAQLALSIAISGRSARACGPLRLALSRPVPSRWRGGATPVLELDLTDDAAPGRWDVRAPLRGLDPGPLRVEATLPRLGARAEIELAVVRPVRV